eukprot:9399-Heterococcus_DN1.PRE.5
MATEYEYDYVVIGGGSGGLASAKKAASYGAKVALFDYVKLSPQGTKWGLGGTCVNVGCVPKKLMHYAGLMGPMFSDAKQYGWEISEDKPAHNWSTMVQNVQSHVKMLNFRYRVGLKSAQVTYINALASLSGAHEVTYERRGVAHTVTAKHILIAVGGRPVYPLDVPGAAEYGITSDDIFSLEEAPGKTLVIGASYIALECAGFLTELGYNTTVAVRSILLRGFDRQAASKIGDVMEAQGTRFVKGVVPKSIEKLSDGTLKANTVGTALAALCIAVGCAKYLLKANICALVVLVDAATGNEVLTETYDTVLFGAGRQADTAKLGLETAGVSVLPNGKIPVVDETTNVPHIHALGDCTLVDVEFEDAHWANPELTPVAIIAGQLLAGRLFGKQTDKMDYTKFFQVTTTWHLTDDRSCYCHYSVTVGLSEEDAIKTFGQDNVEVFLTEFTSLELQASSLADKCHMLILHFLMQQNTACIQQVAHRVRHPYKAAAGAQAASSSSSNGKQSDSTTATTNNHDDGMELDDVPPMCMSKLVCKKSDSNRVVGFHFVGPNAGELTQGFALALRLGAKKADFDKLVGIHPTDAESFCDLSVTRASGENFVAAAGCGGGSCALSQTNEQTNKQEHNIIHIRAGLAHISRSCCICCCATCAAAAAAALMRIA